MLLWHDTRNNFSHITTEITALHSSEDLSYYHAIWHTKVASCVIFMWQIA